MGSFIEDFQASLDKLPGLLQRNYGLMRDLDKSLLVAQQQNEQRCEQEIEEIRRGVESGSITLDTSHIRFSNDALDEQKHCIRIADEKVALATQAYDMVDEHIQQLDEYMKKFEELRQEKDISTSSGAGALNVDNAAKPARGSESGRPGRKKSRPPSGPAPAIELDLPVDPNEPTYCFCNQVSFGEMVACDHPNCKIEWFHYGCVGLKEQPKGKWYCPDCIGLQKRRKGK
ncbi:PHD finger protein ING1 [Acorus calamus]|uniref:PHD finger protein ING n=1 Tax=Acorus calamus TaxID=4465 RepID=A0AAV9CQF3_ACOCL|nr:PHD finger protein ING1 [Acorus calamus]